MKGIMFKNSRCISLGSIENEDDLKPISDIANINTPPDDGKCDCCGMHISELKPFGQAGDPLIGDFDGALLVKGYRTLAPTDERVEQIFGEYFGNCNTEDEHEKARQLLINKYGKKETDRLELYYEASHQIGPSWECRECSVLDSDEYFEKSKESYSNA